MCRMEVVRTQEPPRRSRVRTKAHTSRKPSYFYYTWQSLARCTVRYFTEVPAFAWP